MVNVARLAGFDHEPGLEPGALPDEMVMYCGNREQRRDRHPLGPEVTVGEDQDVDAARKRLVGLGANPCKRELGARPSAPRQAR